jgi:hypothetical protein
MLESTTPNPKGNRNNLVGFNYTTREPSVLPPRRNSSLAFFFLIHSSHHGPFLLGVQALKVVFTNCPAVVFPLSCAIIEGDELFSFLLD